MLYLEGASGYTGSGTIIKGAPKAALYNSIFFKSFRYVGLYTDYIYLILLNWKTFYNFFFLRIKFQIMKSRNKKKLNFTKLDWDTSLDLNA